jgi:hypothetical protein
VLAGAVIVTEKEAQACSAASLQRCEATMAGGGRRDDVSGMGEH